MVAQTQKSINLVNGEFLSAAEDFALRVQEQRVNPQVMGHNVMQADTSFKAMMKRIGYYDEIDIFLPSVTSQGGKRQHAEAER